MVESEGKGKPKEKKPTPLKGPMLERFVESGLADRILKPINSDRVHKDLSRLSVVDVAIFVEDRKFPQNPYRTPEQRIYVRYPIEEPEGSTNPNDFVRTHYVTSDEQGVVGRFIPPLTEEQKKVVTDAIEDSA